jgi:hypothetical protein
MEVLLRNSSTLLSYTTSKPHWEDGQWGIGWGVGWGNRPPKWYLISLVLYFNIQTVDNGMRGLA